MINKKTNNNSQYMNVYVQILEEEESCVIGVAATARCVHISCLCARAHIRALIIVIIMTLDEYAP